jgi:antitoxin component YwqK of YwqJK toxin-antitoxin module
MKKLFALTVLLIFGSLSGIGQELIQVGDRYCTADSVHYTGSYTTYHANGTRAAIYSFKEGKLNNGVTFYDENGRMCMTGFFADNKPHGLWQSWSAKGIPLSSAKYDHGKKVGLWTIRYAESDASYVLNYSNDELVEARLDQP